MPEKEELQHPSIPSFNQVWSFVMSCKLRIEVQSMCRVVSSSKFCMLVLAGGDHDIDTEKWR
jgi:hypothetical protein